MKLEQAITALFRMDERTWMRHAHPGSVWSRASVYPLLIAVIWYRTALGYWTLPLVALLLVWTWLNPRVFPPPRTTSRWASKSVFGERVWLRRRQTPIPARHRTFPQVLNALNGLATLLIVWGLIEKQFWPCLSGLLLTYAFKFWFLDRMVWLFEDMYPHHPEYARWLY